MHKVDETMSARRDIRFWTLWSSREEPELKVIYG